MTKTSSRDWDSFNLERRDRRHKEADEQKLKPPTTASASWNKKRRRKFRTAEADLTRLKKKPGFVDEDNFLAVAGWMKQNDP